MTDKELLELAANAAEIEWYGFFGGDKNACMYLDIGENDVVKWNPLTDDGDALRLAVKLGLTVQVGANVFVYSDPDFCDSTPCIEVCEIIGNDPYAATRRSIVRAAAEIGKTK